MEEGSISDTGKLLTKFENLSFISTNDVLSSAFFNVVYARLPMFTRNIQDRCPEFAEEMAVKYETLMIIDPFRHESQDLI